MSKTNDQARGGSGVPGTPASGASTRERLLLAAVTVGARAGWGGITTRSVAAQAGVIPGVVHYHLGSVAALRREAVRRALEELAAQVQRQLSTEPDPTAALMTTLRGITADEPSDATALVHEAYLAAGREPEVRTLLVEQVAELRAWLTPWIDARTADRPDREDPAALAAGLVAALDGLYLHRVLDPTFDAVAAGGPLIRAVLGGGRAGPDAGSRADATASRGVDP